MCRPERPMQQTSRHMLLLLGRRRPRGKPPNTPPPLHPPPLETTLTLPHPQILKKIHLIDFNANRRYLLEKTQHLIGGFGKTPGDPPGIHPLSLIHI